MLSVLQAVTQKRYKSDQDVRWLLIGGTNSAHAIAKTRHVGEVQIVMMMTNSFLCCLETGDRVRVKVRISVNVLIIKPGK